MKPSYVIDDDFLKDKQCCLTPLFAKSAMWKYSPYFEDT